MWGTQCIGYKRKQILAMKFESSAPFVPQKVRLNFSLTEFSQLESDVILASYRKWRQRLI